LYRDFTQVLDYAKKLETKDLIVASPEDKEVIIAVNDAYQTGLINPVLVGNKKIILDLLMELGISKKGYEIYNAVDHKDAALMSVKLASKQETAILMKGSLQSRILLEELCKEEHQMRKANILSHIGVLQLQSYTKLLFFSDSVMNVLPSENDKIEIINNALEFVTTLGIRKPKIGLVSAVEIVNEEIVSTVEAASIVNKLKDNEDFYIGGPFAVDILVSDFSAQTKGINHVCAGDADILIFPNIESGNTFYKTTTFLGNATAAGLILGGKVPVVVNSRADSHKSKLYSIALAVVSTEILWKF